MRNKREDSFYEIQSVTKALVVLEALEGTAFEPVSIQRLINRTGINRLTLEGYLKTFRLRGWAAQNDRGQWTIGRRFVRLAHAAVTADPGLNSGAPEFKGPFSPVSC